MFGESSVMFVQTDVTEPEDWERLWEKSVEFFQSPIDVLCNNAGVSPSLGFERCKKEINLRNSSLNLSFISSSDQPGRCLTGGPAL